MGPSKHIPSSTGPFFICFLNREIKFCCLKTTDCALSLIHKWENWTKEENIFPGEQRDGTLMAEAEPVPGLPFQPRALLARGCQF